MLACTNVDAIIAEASAQCCSLSSGPWTSSGNMSVMVVVSRPRMPKRTGPDESTALYSPPGISPTCSPSPAPSVLLSLTPTCTPTPSDMWNSVPKTPNFPVFAMINNDPYKYLHIVYSPPSLRHTPPPFSPRYLSVLYYISLRAFVFRYNN